MKKHRLVLLLGILVALIFFYLGLNTWMASQEQRSTPPPVVRIKPPVQIKPPAQPVKPAPPEPKTEEEAPKPKVVKLTPTKTKKEEKKAAEEPKPEAGKPKKVAKKEKKSKRVKALREYVVQIGAFKFRENARKRFKMAKDKGFEAFIIEEEGLYKVRVRVKARSLLSALREVRGEFKGAFIVR